VKINEWSDIWKGTITAVTKDPKAIKTTNPEILTDPGHIPPHPSIIRTIVTPLEVPYRPAHIQS
jgi:hypothetical protein